MFKSKKKLILADELISLIFEASETMGCTPEEFANKHLKSKCEEVLASKNNSRNKQATPEEIEQISQQLKGLGYLE